MLTQRLENVRQQLNAQGIDCLALVPGFNLRYLTGMDFMLLERPFIAFIPADETTEPVLVIPELEVPTWKRGAPFEARIFAWDDKSGSDEAMRQASKALPGMRTLAVEYLRMRVLEHDLISRFVPDARVVKGEAVLDPLRMRKDASEIASLRRAVEVAEAALEEVVSSLSPGVAEREICSQLTSAMLLGGGETVPFEPLVLSGPRSALPHGRTGERRVETGEILLIDFGTTVNGYHSDITRTFVVGQEPNDRLREVYAAVQAANEAGRAAVRPGATYQDVDRAARQVLVDAGFGEHFIHRTGHGLGLDVHEEPGIVEGNDMPLEEGMVFTIEPGVYLEGWGGIRIEDNVVVTADGCESLTTFSRELRVVAS
ncbi:MAG: Xaa-Pro peptidase family protein [Anaerolineae bacterium]|nr:Xaa-Pro peptidase family protein [Anaerolineae bacterium]